MEPLDAPPERGELHVVQQGREGVARCRDDDFPGKSGAGSDEEGGVVDPYQHEEFSLQACVVAADVK